MQNPNINICTYDLRVVNITPMCITIVKLLFSMYHQILERLILSLHKLGKCNKGLYFCSYPPFPILTFSGLKNM